jgi:hypothetical protein
VEGEKLSLSQQIAMTCREADIDRHVLVGAVANRKRASELTRVEAEQILQEAKAILRGEKRLVEVEEGIWMVAWTEGPADMIEPETSP